MRPDSVGLAAAGVGLGGLALLLLSQRRGPALVLYSDNAELDRDVGTFRGVALRAGALHGVEPQPVGNGAELLDAVRSQPRIGTLLIIGHGTTSSIIRPGVAGLHTTRTSLPAWVSVEDFATVTAPRLTSGFWLGLLGCRTAAEAWEDDWTDQTLAPEGNDSLAGQLRDALFYAGAPSGKVGGHTTTGATDANPRARVFPVAGSQVGQWGIPVALTQGERAIAWAFTGK